MPATRTQPDVIAGTPTERVTARPVDLSHPLVTRYLEILMMRNFATNTWQFKANHRLSAPGCVIASPAEPGDPGTDQSYANCWVRDSALCVAQAADIDLPWANTDLLDDYVAFSRLTQRTAQHQNRPGHACFFIDGALRPWSIQNDGPALRVISVLGFLDRLSETVRAEARALVVDDLTHLLGVYQSPTTNLWEETSGFHFFTRAVQKRCFELAANPCEALPVDAGALVSAAERLTAQLEEHWHTDSCRNRGYYRATVGGHGRGDDIDSSTLMGAVYGRLRATQPRLLATASVIWDSFRTLYNINHDDHAHGIGPMIGRYPEDEYDGDCAEQPNVGHPWPVCTAVFAEYYYRVARQLKQDGELRIDDLTSRFFEQIDVTPGPGVYRADSPQFDLALGKLRDAGDRMLGAVIAHSDHLELSEQVDRHTGFQKSVRNLTWSYAAYLSAARVRQSL